MNYIVLDLEWNQCPAGKEYEKPGLPVEIFDVGAVKLDENRNIIDRFSSYIKPRVYTRLHFITMELTHASMEEINSGASFEEVMERFLKWCGNDGDYMFCTWGNTDLLELQRNLKYFGCENPLPFPLKYYDIQKLYSIENEDGKIRRSLEYAVDAFGIEKGSVFHNAISDAEYTADVFGKMSFQNSKQFYSIDTYRIPDSDAEEIFASFGNYAKYITRGYDTREEVLASKRLLSTICFKCGKPARKKIRWFSTNSKMHYCLAECKDHGYMKCRFKVREDDFGKYYAIKILKYTDEAGAENIKSKKQELKKKRYTKKVGIPKIRG